MEYSLLILLIVIIFLILLTLRRSVIFEYQRGLLYTRGKFVRILEPGARLYIPLLQSIQKIDMRLVYVTIPGQEVLSADNVSLRISLVAGYKVSDPHLAVYKVANYAEALYLLLQLSLRDVIGSYEIDELLTKREEIGKLLFEKTAEKATELGLQLILVNLKDIMFPGELKNIFAQVVNARKEGQAALERARGESAALRNLANAARLFEENPNLHQLRLIQALENRSSSALVILPTEGLSGTKSPEKKGKANKG